MLDWIYSELSKFTTNRLKKNRNRAAPPLITRVLIERGQAIALLRKIFTHEAKQPRFYISNYVKITEIRRQHVIEKEWSK